MPALAYQDFDLLLDRDADGYRVRVLTSPAGQSTAAVRFAQPFAPLELENFLLRVGGRKRGVRGAAVDDMRATIADFGGRLFAAVFTGEVADLLAASRGATNGPTAGLRVRIRFDGCPELADLPWEYLYDRAADRFLCLSERTPLVRYLPLREPVEPLAVAGPLRILTVIANPTVDGADLLDVEREWANLTEAVARPVAEGRIVVDRLPAANLTELHRHLGRQDYHVLHFVGHGRFREAVGVGELLFESARGGPQEVSANDLAVLLYDHRSLRLVVLNSCEGARAGAADPFAGTAQTLIRQGVPAVVAMQFEISDPAAIAFSQGLYEAIAAGRALDAAVAFGRTRVHALPNRVEWATPVLHTRAADTRIFSFSAPAPAPATPAPATPTPAGPAPATPVAATPVAATPAPATSPPAGPASAGPAEEPSPAAHQPPPGLARVREAAAARPRWRPAPPPPAPPRAGRVVAWGRDVVRAPAGTAEWTVSAGPPMVPKLGDVAAIAAGSGHSLALRADGHMIAWGRDTDGQATAIRGRATAVAAGSRFNIALLPDGQIRCWGSNEFGQSTPPAGLAAIVAISAGSYHGLALHTSGNVVAWGDNRAGQAGVPAILADVTAISAGSDHSLALHSDGQVTGWGSCGLFRNPGEFIAIAAGHRHGLMLTPEGRVVAWGSNENGCATVPRGLTNVVAIAAGRDYSLALRGDGTVVAWGHQDIPAGSLTPDRLTNVVAIATHHRHSLAIVAD